MCSPYIIEKKKVVENDLVIVTHVHLIFCMETCDLALLGRYVLCSRESINLQLLSS